MVPSRSFQYRSLLTMILTCVSWRCWCVSSVDAFFSDMTSVWSFWSDFSFGHSENDDAWFWWQFIFLCSLYRLRFFRHFVQRGMTLFMNCLIGFCWLLMVTVYFRAWCSDSCGVWNMMSVDGVLPVRCLLSPMCLMLLYRRIIGNIPPGKNPPPPVL